MLSYTCAARDYCVDLGGAGVRAGNGEDLAQVDRKCEGLARPNLLLYLSWRHGTSIGKIRGEGGGESNVAFGLAWLSTLLYDP